MATKVSKLHETTPQVQGLYDRGVTSVIPLFKGKSPGYADWQKMSEEEAAERFYGWNKQEKKPGTGEVNYGIRLGPSFGDICDIDLDSEESRRLARYYLPGTARFGRGGICTHFLYKQIGRVKVPSHRYQWDKRDEKSVLLELRASGQTMGPGSIHPTTGEKIVWMSEEGQGITEVEGVELGTAVDHLAAASLLLRDWNGGGRDELAVCLVGSMLRGDWACGDIDKFLEPIILESGDEESGMRFKASRLEDELRSGGRVPGLKRLRELCSGGGLGVAGFERIVEWLELGGGDIIEEINNEYAVAVLPGGGGVAIMKESSAVGGEGEGVSFLDRSSFSLMYANRSVRVSGRDVTADKFWLGHKDRREYLRGVVFRPGQDVREGEYNLWRGFSVAPVERGEGEAFGSGWKLFHDHIREEICGGVEEYFTWIIGWMAQRVQRPWQVPESSIVLVGERGDGKGSLFKIFGRLFGRHYMTVTQPKHLLGNFNKHLIDKVLVFADEAVWGGDKTNEGVLKTMISEDSRVIEIKGKDAFTVANCTGYGIASNNEWVVPVGRHERRFMILRTVGGVRGDLEYFDRLYAEMSAEGGERGLGRMLWDLSRVDIGGWRGNRPPRTADMAGQMLAGMEHWVAFLVEYVEGGGCDDGMIWSSVVYEEFLRWNRERGYKHPLARIPFFKNLNMALPSGERVRRNTLGFITRGGVVHPSGRDYVYRFLRGVDQVKEELNAFCGMQMV